MSNPSIKRTEAGAPLTGGQHHKVTADDLEKAGYKKVGDHWVDKNGKEMTFAEAIAQYEKENPDS